MKRVTSASLLVLLFVISITIVACGPAGGNGNTPAATVTQQAFAPITEADSEAGGESAPAGAYPAPGQGAYPAPDRGAYPAYPAPEISPSPSFSGDAPKFEGQIVFQSERFGNLQVFILDGETGEVTQVTETYQAYEPAWSPDCQTIVYSHELGVNNSEIYKVNPGSRLAVPFLEEVRTGTLEWSPAWSATGDMVAFQSNPGAQINVCFATATGTLLECMAQGNSSNAQPSFSPDGSQVLFISNRDGNWDIYLSDTLTGEDAVNLTNNDGVNFHPRFSPDGRRIVFESADIDGSFDIYLMDADGGNLQRLTTSNQENSDPSWMGNDKILYASNEIGDWELYWMDAGGGNQTRLTFFPGLDRAPAWCQGR
jgi:Tol biopolymer transport system component